MRVLTQVSCRRVSRPPVNIHPSLLPAFTGLDTNTACPVAGVGGLQRGHSPFRIRSVEGDDRCAGRRLPVWRTIRRTCWRRALLVAETCAPLRSLDSGGRVSLAGARVVRRRHAPQDMLVFASLIG